MTKIKFQRPQSYKGYKGNCKVLKNYSLRTLKTTEAIVALETSATFTIF
jgi:hypothetical protein